MNKNKTIASVDDQSFINMEIIHRFAESFVELRLPYLGWGTRAGLGVNTDGP